MLIILAQIFSSRHCLVKSKPTLLSWWPHRGRASGLANLGRNKASFLRLLAGQREPCPSQLQSGVRSKALKVFAKLMPNSLQEPDSQGSANKLDPQKREFLGLFIAEFFNQSSPPPAAHHNQLKSATQLVTQQCWKIRNSGDPGGRQGKQSVIVVRQEQVVRKAH